MRRVPLRRQCGAYGLDSTAAVSGAYLDSMVAQIAGGVAKMLGEPGAGAAK
jgi:hypothetical protein